MENMALSDFHNIQLDGVHMTGANLTKSDKQFVVSISTHSKTMLIFGKQGGNLFSKKSMDLNQMLQLNNIGIFGEFLENFIKGYPPILPQFFFTISRIHISCRFRRNSAVTEP